MTTLLVAKQILLTIYSKYEVYITPLLKFLLALVTLLLINSRLGYMETINRTTVVLIVALMCSFMPMNFIVLMGAVFTLLHLYTFSLECAAVIGAGFFAPLFAVSAFRPEGYAGSGAFANLFPSADSLCDSIIHGADRDTGFGCFRCLRRDCLLHDPLCNTECDGDCGYGGRGDCGQISVYHRRAS